jgi:hypothetical protein
MGKRFARGAIYLAVLVFLLTQHSAHAETIAPGLVVNELDYVDTSGEVLDQRAAHAERLRAFADGLRNDLAASGKFRIVALDCAHGSCAGAAENIPKGLAEAERAGAAYVMFGGIHKKSTLVQWAKIQILDVKTQRIVFDRLLTFRGDNDVSWRRAGAFLVRDILEQDTMK